ncbi:MAG TPA: uroporphyrinogen-III synthase [Rubrivivax sp.]|nr:uroporphyrinogen-III synthase [Rubrivivax sp.]
MRVIVTRPQAQAEPLAARLRAAGIDAVTLPLIEIAAAHDAQPLRAAWAALGEYTLAMFVSANAVQYFMQARPHAARWPQPLWAAAPGPGTAAMLRAAGVPPARLVEPRPGDAYDSEALWQRLREREWQGRRVLVLRGENGRDWLGEQLRSRGAQVDFVAAYRRVLPRLDAAAGTLLEAAAARPRDHLWLVSSSEAAANLRRLAPQADWAQAAAVAPHARIVAALHALGFGEVALVPVDAAALAAVVRSRGA